MRAALDYEVEQASERASNDDYQLFVDTCQSIRDSLAELKDNENVS